jgi:hypothetical protein
MFMDGGLDAQTIRLEGNISRRTVGGSSIIVRYAGPECIGGCLEEPLSGQFSSVKARFPRRGAAVLACELARLPWSAIDLSRLKLHATGMGNAGKPEIRSFRCLAGRTPANLPHGSPGRAWILAGLAILILAGLRQHVSSQEDS